MFAVSSTVTSIAVEVKVTSPLASSAALKKSSDMKCASRFSQPVNMLSTGIETVTLLFSGLSLSHMMSPSKPENIP